MTSVDSNWTRSGQSTSGQCQAGGRFKLVAGKSARKVETDPYDPICKRHAHNHAGEKVSSNPNTHATAGHPTDASNVTVKVTE